MDGFDIKVERLRRDLTQRDLSRLAGIPTHRISEIERRCVRPRPEEWQRIAKALADAAGERT